MNNRPIGVFDSGVGGLTVVKELIRQLPNENIVYFGDTARVPYGVKSKPTIIRFSTESILFLLKKKVKLICVACNTASSLALPSIKGHFNIPLLGVIAPGAEKASSLSKTRRIGVIGTRATINSRSYEKELKRIDPKIKVFTQACALFVPFVEEAWLNKKPLEDVARVYLEPLKRKKIDTLILGCTHYPLLKKLIKKIMGPKVILVDSAKETVKQLRELLINKGCLRQAMKKAKKIFYVTDEKSSFFDLGKSFLDNDSIKVMKVNNV